MFCDFCKICADFLFGANFNNEVCHQGKPLQSIMLYTAAWWPMRATQKICSRHFFEKKAKNTKTQ